MSATFPLSLFDIEMGLLNLIVVREDIANDPDLTPVEQQEKIRECETAIAEYVKAEVSKADGIAFNLREFEARANALKAEAKRLRDKAEAWERRYEFLKDITASTMQAMGRKRIDGAKNTLRIQANPASVEIAQPDLVPMEYCEHTVTIPQNILTSILDVLEEHAPELFSVFIVIPSNGPEPVKSIIAAVLKQIVKCERCDGTGLYTVPFELRLRDETGVEECGACQGKGKVRQGVPGCTLRTDSVNLRIE